MLKIIKTFAILFGSSASATPISTALSQDKYLCIKRDCGAVPKTSFKVELNDTLTNAKALQTCIARANQGEGSRVVVIPHGYAFSSMPTSHVNLTDVTLQIDGVWEAAPFYDEWPNANGTYPADSKHLGTGDKLLNFLSFANSTNITIRGQGIVDGLGYNWWIREWNHMNKRGRPVLLSMIRIQTGEISGVKWLNSPRFYMYLSDIDSFFIHDFEIRTDILKQYGWVTTADKSADTFEDRFNDFVYQFMLHFFGDYVQIVDFLFSGKTDWTSWPTMPLNTDGIDPSGSNVTIKNIKITNWDDAIAIKPSRIDKMVVAKDACTQDILVQNLTVLYGVGASIGSVGPKDGHTCVRRVTFKDVKFDYPMKAIYIKTNPGITGTGEIKDILYENITINNPIWYGIYIGPQQQKEPDGRGSGCMTYPLEGCPTQPLIDVRNITLKNVQSKGGILPPGIIRCNSTNPCRDINFDNVQVDGWWRDLNWTFISEYAYGNVVNSNVDPLLNEKSERVFDLYSFENIITFISQLMGYYNKNQTDIVGWQTIFGIIMWALSLAIDGGHF